FTKFLYHRRTHGALPALPVPPSTPPDDLPAPVLEEEEEEESPAGSFRCSACGKGFSKAPQLARHQRFVHRLERRHAC
ncbi:ZN574 protein, partial [Asarcornis scutulata]|nr:ZN574 protein [Asarcornis scutulata]